MVASLPKYQKEQGSLGAPLMNCIAAMGMRYSFPTFSEIGERVGANAAPSQMTSSSVINLGTVWNPSDMRFDAIRKFGDQFSITPKPIPFWLHVSRAVSESTQEKKIWLPSESLEAWT